MFFFLAMRRGGGKHHHLRGCPAPGRALALYSRLRMYQLTSGPLACSVARASGVWSGCPYFHGNCEHCKLCSLVVSHGDLVPPYAFYPPLFPIRCLRTNGYSCVSRCSRTGKRRGSKQDDDSYLMRRGTPAMLDDVEGHGAECRCGHPGWGLPLNRFRVHEGGES
jgi:hypothetical protein